MLHCLEASDSKNECELSKNMNIFHGTLSELKKSLEFILFIGHEIGKMRGYSGVSKDPISIDRLVRSLDRSLINIQKYQKEIYRFHSHNPNKESYVIHKDTRKLIETFGLFSETFKAYVDSFPILKILTNEPCLSSYVRFYKFSEEEYQEFFIGVECNIVTFTQTISKDGDVTTNLEFDLENTALHSP